MAEERKVKKKRIEAEELWKDVQDERFRQFYEVSNLGRIRSKPRYVKRVNRWKKPFDFWYTGNIMQLRTNGIEKHLFAGLRYNEDGVKKLASCYVHKAVAEAFVQRSDKPKVRKKKISGTPYFVRTSHYYRYVEHIDGDYNNNKWNNLRWMTAYDLHLKQVRQGRKVNLELYKYSSCWKKGQAMKKKKKILK